ncbi:hypothetical protein HYE54_12410 [Aggregatibacter actinomycetemcomitans]|uniref:hypothetical protein n=1 Tax=Aggregatibacter actinomycetemcomitans TaxID=714 RepID=UPI00197C5F46|nr:hypothetical protein [Aggregatibacter actinomycetemcomitans]MBN6069494.1 hypothetical protein [Aggregatibacter actinomycetemcomitans]MBN6087068.1 hypothetical protein [Aggregatibacter actinomycetemcomitans]
MRKVSEQEFMDHYINKALRSIAEKSGVAFGVVAMMFASDSQFEAEVMQLIEKLMFIDIQNVKNAA